ncbi:MAG: hypothetical protein ACXWR1_17045 [Bdellovibrionota bacterium]
MGFRQPGLRKGRSVENAGILALVALLAGAPVAEAASTIPGTITPVGQSGAQTQSAGTNTLASTLGKAAGVLSMAAGGLYIAKGVNQMKCCTSGCTGSGAESQTDKAKQDLKNQNDAKKIQRQPIDYFKLRFPDEAKACPARAPELRIFSFLQFFQPQKADATLGGCLDAGIAIATGGLMLLNGIMGLQAASQSGQMANTSLDNAGNMDSFGATGTSPTPPGTNSAGLGNTGGAINGVKLDPALLRTGTANDIMSQFEQKFGMGRDQFADGVLNGQDPRSLLGSAPKNALSNDDMNKAIAGAKSMSDADKAKALADSPMGNLQRELASRMGDGSVNMAGASPATGAFKKKDSELDPLDAPPAAADAAAVGISPDVQAALAAKEMDDRKNGITDLTIFEVVHAKYREKSKMIFGFDPDGLPKGNGNGI